MHKILFYSLLILASQSWAYDLKPQYRNYGVNDGLPSSQVYEIIQDAKGYVWFGTDRGLVRYNGYEFKTFTVQDGLTNNVIFHLDEGPDGTIYAYGMDGQISCLSENRFRAFKYNDNLKVYQSNQSNQSNLLSFDFSEYGFSYSAIDNHEYSMPHVMLTKHNQLKKETEWDFQIIDNETGTFIFGKSKDSLQGLSVNGKMVQFEEPRLRVQFANAVNHEGVIYFTLENTLYRYDHKKQDKLEKVERYDNKILDLKVDGSGNLYLDFFVDGLLKLNVENLSLKEYIIKDASISSMLIDKNNGIWAAGLYKGLFYIEDQEKYKVELSNDQQLNQLETLDGNIYGLTDQRKFFKFQFADDSIIDLDVSYPLDIMSKPNSVIVFSDGNRYSKKLADYERLLTESFYRIHHSIIVNLKWFSHLKKIGNFVVLKNGSELPISRRKKSDFKKVMLLR